MKKRQVRAVRMICAVIVAVFSGGSVGGQCFQQSPALAEKGDTYYEIPESSDLSKAQRKELNRLVAKIRGNWKEGTGKWIDCRGSDANPRVEEHDIETDLEISLSRGNELRVEERRYDKQRKSRSREIVKLFGSESNAQVDKLSENQLVAIEKYRRRQRPKCSSLWEIVHDFQLSGDRLYYTTTRYINGYVSSRDTRIYRRNPYRTPR